MSSERSIEITGESIEDAIAKGLSQLGVGPAEVIVEVLEEPSQAMFGMDARPARVRLQLLGGALSSAARSTSPPAPLPNPKTPPITASDAPRPARDRQRDERPSAVQKNEPRQQPAEPRRPRRSNGVAKPRPRQIERVDDGTADNLEPDIDETLPVVQVAEELAENELNEDVTVARVVLNELLERMDIRSRIAVRRSAPDDQTGAAPYILDIMSSGNSNRLIGRRGETLAALQYLTRLITSREVQHRVEVIVDVNSYKARRAQALTTLALRMADDAIAGQRTVVLEPMPPHERRIVHLALRDRNDVTTKSIGEGPARKVTIIPAASSQ